MIEKLLKMVQINLENGHRTKVKWIHVQMEQVSEPIKKDLKLGSVNFLCFSYFQLKSLVWYSIFDFPKPKKEWKNSQP
jgi:hypothetical protein